MALKRTPLNKEWLNLKSHWGSSKTGANLMGQDSKFCQIWRTLIRTTYHKPGVTSPFVAIWSRDVHLCFKSFVWVFKGLRERTLKIRAKLLFILVLEDFHHMWHKTSYFFSFNDDCLNYWVLKAVYNRFVTYRFRVWLFNNPTPRHHYFPIWNMCRYFQTQSLALRAKYNISHVSFILNAPVEAINNTCHCTEKIPFEIGNFFCSDDQ